MSCGRPVGDRILRQAEPDEIEQRAGRRRPSAFDAARQFLRLVIVQIPFVGDALVGNDAGGRAIADFPQVHLFTSGVSLLLVEAISYVFFYVVEAISYAVFFVMFLGILGNGLWKLVSQVKAHAFITFGEFQTSYQA